MIFIIQDHRLSTPVRQPSEILHVRNVSVAISQGRIGYSCFSLVTGLKSEKIQLAPKESNVGSQGRQPLVGRSA